MSRSGLWKRSDPDRHHDGPYASIVIVTYNRLPMLQRCMDAVLARTQDPTHEIIVWDNASTDGTAEFLDGIAARDTRVRVVHSPANVGVNGVAESVDLCRGAYIIEMDDDVIDVPVDWLPGMIAAFRAVPRAGYLSADVVQDDLTNGAKPPTEHYRALRYGGGIVIEHGPAGGWCAITSRKVVDAVGGFLRMPGRIFFSEDGDFCNRCLRHFFAIGVIRGLKVYHAAGTAANAKFGSLDVARLKYSDSPEYDAMLQDTLRAMDRRDDANADGD